MHNSACSVESTCRLLSSRCVLVGAAHDINIAELLYTVPLNIKL